jgi:energy-coupling factor transport system ATP-binding protein
MAPFTSPDTMVRDSAALVSVRQLSFTYRRTHTPALIDISLEVRPGEVLLIAGPSGCGKSTLLRCLNGLIPTTYSGEMWGTIMVGGRDALDLTLADVSRTVGTVLQDPERQIVASHVFEEVAFGLENLGLPPAEIRVRVEETLRELNLLHLAERECFTLSGGEKQKLAIAGVLTLQPQVLLLDEPLANLDPASARETLALCRQLANAGRSVVIVEHRVEEVLSIDPERVVLLDEGRIIYEGPGEGINTVADPRAVKLPVSIAVERMASLGVTPPPPLPPRESGGPPLIALSDVEFSYGDKPVLRGVSLAIAPGDRIALLGRNGSGKSTLVKQMIGLLRPQRGTVLIDGVPLAKLSVAQAARSVGYVFQSPSHMLFAPSVREEMAFGPRNIGQSEAEITAHTAEALALMGMSDLLERAPLTLSFGQQRRLCIASVIAMRAKVLLMDEPTAGQDYRSYTQFMDGIQRLGVFAAQVFITHDLDLAISYANRVVLFDDGQIVADGAPHEVLSQEDLLRHCSILPTSLLRENLRLLPYTHGFVRLEGLTQLITTEGSEHG